MKALFGYLKERHRGKIPLAVLMALYAAFCVGALIYFAVLGSAHARDCVIALAYLIVIPIFYSLEYVLNVRAPFFYALFIVVYCVFCFLGASFNFYTIIPCLDDILHAGWGLLFCSLGFCVVKSLMGEPKTTKAFIACLIFSVGFCMILSILWEIYEYTFDCVTSSFDMQEDVIVNRIHSFMLHDPYDHLHTLNIEGIAYTEIFDKDGNLLYRVEGGYLDIGLNDTMMDLIYCTVASAVFCAVLAIDRRFGAKVYAHFVPVYLGERAKRQPVTKAAEGESAENTNTEENLSACDGDKTDTDGENMQEKENMQDNLE